MADSEDDFTRISNSLDRFAKATIHNRNMLFLEASISAMMDTCAPEEAATILREHADQLEVYG